MRIEEIIEATIAEGKSLNRNERAKAAGEFDALYLNERIKHHRRGVRLTRSFITLTYISLIVSTILLFVYEDLGDVSKLWLKGLMVVLTALCLVGLPTMSKNHGRNASLLRLVRKMRASSTTPQS